MSRDYQTASTIGIEVESLGPFRVPGQNQLCLANKRVLKRIHWKYRVSRYTPLEKYILIVYIDIGWAYKNDRKGQKLCRNVPLTASSISTKFQTFSMDFVGPTMVNIDYQFILLERCIAGHPVKVGKGPHWKPWSKVIYAALRPFTGNSLYTGPYTRTVLQTVSTRPLLPALPVITALRIVRFTYTSFNGAR